METQPNFSLQPVQLSLLNEHSAGIYKLRGEYVYIFNVKNTANSDGCTQTLTFEFHTERNISFFNETYSQKSENGKYYEHSAEIVPYTFHVSFLETYDYLRNGATISELVLPHQIRQKIDNMFSQFVDNLELYHEFTSLEIFPLENETYFDYLTRIENFPLNS